jgi:arylsulfatase A-like enzyme/Flp pilus assembly protein TadD
MDTVRADRLGSYGSRRGLTPNLDAVAKQGIVFDHAYAQAPLTPVTHASILTGTYPPFHKVQDFGSRLGPSLPYLPELLRSQGYRTGAFVSSIVLDPRNGFAPGFERGFDVFDAGFRRRQKGDDRYKSVERRADITVARAMEWLQEGKAAPFFLWVHVWDAHEPYDPPAPYKARFPSAPYDAEIAYMDAMLGKLFSDLRAKGLFDDALIVILSDHGEGLGGHGEKSHGIFLYDETIHIPLLVKLPGGKSAGQRVKTRVGQVDVAPTILEAARIPAPGTMHGDSLIRLATEKSARDRPTFAETQYSRRAFGWSPLAAVRTDRYLFIQAPQQELYDVTTDPGATKNLAPSNRAMTARLAKMQEDFVTRVRGNAPEPAQGSTDERTAEKLRSLGYVASGPANTTASSGIDPKGRIQVANDLHDANLIIEDGHPERVIPLLERVVASDPQIQTAQFFLGVAYSRQRDYAKAIPPLKKAIELQPDAVMAHYEMGLALFETGDRKTAATHFEIVVERSPKWIDARYSLASVQARIDQVPEAMANLILVLDNNPNHYRGNLLLGRLLTLKNQAKAAIPHLEKAAASPEASGEAHRFLADAYDRLGRTADAQRARAQAARMGPPRRQ